MKKKISILAAILLIFGLTACGNNAGQAANDTPQTTQAESSQETEVSNNTEAETEETEISDHTEAETEETEAADHTEAETDQTVADASASDGEEPVSEETASAETDSTKENGGVLVVYFSATGTTKGIAEKIADITGADTYEIKAAQEYTDADLNWNDPESRSTREQNDASARPEIGSDAVSLEGYTRIYIGYPIWWGEEPRIMDTFVESYNFDGITLIPFCTSGGSGIGRSGQNLADHAGSGEWLSGQRFSGSASEDEIRSWIEGLQ